MSLFGRIKVKETLRISKRDLHKLLAENAHMQKQITELQADNTRLLLENRSYKQDLTIPWED